MNLKELKELIALMNEHQLIEVELEREGMKIRLKKAGAVAGDGVVIERAIAASPQVAVAPMPVPEQAPKATGTEIKSPMVGTFYRAPAPEAPPFVEVGQEIKPGQVLCIIEAMKLMNEIKSEVKGRIVKIAVENAQPVEFGQVLFVVEPS
ncbi:MAG: acetyl-CoA carboxylase biotin carboxyl carrier protein [Candidatus Omnitrophica bacterium]|nr:acetyl-CoA carboxylase biotin carboxyl carrier protein [Candidatus Omnitrophota bacterium]